MNRLYCALSPILFLFITVSGVSAQTASGGDSDFDQIFISKADMEDLAKLQTYIENKESQIQNINVDFYSLSFSRSRLDTTDIKSCLSILRRSKDSVITSSKYPRCASCIRAALSTTDSLTAKTAMVAKDVLETFLNDEFEKSRTYSQKADGYTRRLSTLTSDKLKAQKLVSKIYNVASVSNDFKLASSITFGIVIVLLLVFFFYFLYSKGDKELVNSFVTGRGLQFVALFALIVAIVLFGVQGILEGKELAAILSGISGFILGKEMNNTPKGTTPSSTSGPNDTSRQGATLTNE